IEEPHKHRHLVQCQNCQDYGHTHIYCNHTPRCVRYSKNHQSSTCDKPIDVPKICALYQGNHPANYRGYQIHIPQVTTKETQSQLSNDTNLNIKLESSEHIEDTITKLNQSIQSTAWNSTPISQPTPPFSINIPAHIRNLINEKRRAITQLQRTKYPSDNYQMNHSLTVASISLQDATKKAIKVKPLYPPLKQTIITWAIEYPVKAHLFKTHLAEVYNPDFSNEIEKFLIFPLQITLPIKQKFNIALTHNLKVRHPLLISQPTNLSSISSVEAEVPQGAISAPVLIKIFIADQPSTPNTFVAEYTDNKAILSTHENPITASIQLQFHLSCL
ncbi:hypothetical protein AGLY_008933, partial [Aphis glycines]